MWKKKRIGKLHTPTAKTSNNTQKIHSIDQNVKLIFQISNNFHLNTCNLFDFYPSS